jgi:N-acyl-D-aspartate/D-glutamate deacylase
MQRLAEEALDDGAVGFSSCLIYAPGVDSQTSELIALASVLQGSGRPYTTHMRGETLVRCFAATPKTDWSGSQLCLHPRQVMHSVSDVEMLTDMDAALGYLKAQPDYR